LRYSRSPRKPSAEDVGLAVAVVIDPGGGLEVVVVLQRQQVGDVLELLAVVVEQARAGGGGQEEIGLAVAVVIGPGRGPGPAFQGQVDFVERSAGVL